ncbi:timeless-domain-containing protein [Sporormia fimetaria CBS 119925]|uniref:Topoisomerase 1-associated factor 1 n=1 Tax=Sporormia fimetaria CBS 119925 TaxID=1340428 RepID=A0A6A6VFR4_9PLEO|nr:timeless-domain-containing protein [Sporormia fimetaria CBS 119925]
MAQQTTLDEWARDPLVDPEVRAHVYSLVNALGGNGEDGTYTLGDDALLCLKDLRKWLKFADAELGRRDAARCMAEAKLLQGDLLPILAKMSEKLMTQKLKYKVALAVLELLVPLTWPYEIDPLEPTENQINHAPYIQLAQIGYKRAILHFDRAQILNTVVKIALPPMAIPLRERGPRDEAIIRIALYFIRNVVMLSPPSSVPVDIDEAEVSRSTTIDTLHDQEIFPALLTVASNIGEDYVVQDVVILEVLFYLLKGIDAEKLFLDEKKLSSRNTDELKALMQKEKAMLADSARHAPTRHNRFGTMVWVKRDDEKVSTLSGQDFLGKAQKTMEKMDKTKKWNKPKGRSRKKNDEFDRDEFDLEVPLTTSAHKHLKSFVEEFLDSSFNPLFMHLRKAIEREEERIEERHSRQYFYLVAWFLKAECARRRNLKEKAADPKSAEILTAEDESYGLVAEVLNQATFILLNRFMQKSQDEKAWQDLNAGMKCFTQILFTVQEMSESALEEDQEIAENIQNRIFYEEATHDRIVQMLRSYKDQGFGYLDACTELAHVFLRMLERYAKQNVDLQIRSKRRARKMEAKRQGADSAGADVSDREEVENAQRTSTERKFDFDRYAHKFVNQSSVNTFMAFLKLHNELDAEQLKRIHRFLYRAVFKMKLGILLFRVDYIQLLHKLIKGPEGLDAALPSFKEWDEFVRHFFRTVVKKVQERPILYVEMLFSKINSTMFYLENGFDMAPPVRTPRAPAELEVKGDMTRQEQIGVAVGVLVNQNKSDALRWVREVLSSAIEERKAWQSMEEARREVAAAERQVEESGEEAPAEEPPKPPSILVRPDNDERRTAMFKDNKLRLLMTLVGCSRLGEPNDPEATWLIGSSVTVPELTEALDLIRKFEFEPPIYEDGKSAQDFLRSKATAIRRTARRVDFDDDSDGVDNDTEEDRGEYAPDGPTARKSTAKKILKRRRRARTPEELDDEEKRRRAEARLKRELEKQRNIKSTVFVHSSDDEDWDEDRDKEFFAKEQALRADTLAQFKRSLALGSPEPASKKRKGNVQAGSEKKKRKTPPKRRKGLFDTDESEDEDQPLHSSSRGSSPEAAALDTESDGESTDTPMSSQPAAVVTNGNKTPASVADKDTVMADAQDGTDDDDEDAAPTVRRAPLRTRGGFVIDSDSE